jgi:hypothetical protein
LEPMPRQQTQLTAAQRRQIDRFMERQAKKEAELGDIKAEIDAWLASDEVSVPAVARYLGLTPEALYQRVRRRK